MAQEALILYYSQFGSTARLAGQIRQLTGADILRVQTALDFPADMEDTDRVYKRQRQRGQLPKLVNHCDSSGRSGMGWAALVANYGATGTVAGLRRQGRPV